MDSPCKNCKDRDIGCHTVCQKYIDYKRILEPLYEDRKRRCEEVGRSIDSINKKKHAKGSKYLTGISGA